MAGEEMAKKYQTLIFLAGSASAEFFADIALCPFEAVKVRRAPRAAAAAARAPGRRPNPPAAVAPGPRPLLAPLTPRRPPPPQVKVQTVPGFAKGMSDGLPRFVAQEGYGGLFKGLTPLWGRQIPYTMMKFGERRPWGLWAAVGV
jgi:solute carrier family 25 phosphate transporter 3